ncbi:MAG: sodium ABC transporter ATP-binding protein, partial [Clostridiaceae bacterium]|nr:sodium ABC transporter ATP-binding protein [Clostridiaceae bacterium]
TFINKGEIIFSTAKDDILENYGLVKGANELINDDNKGIFIGLRENSFGFEALIENKRQARKIFGDKIVVEKPTLEDIMVYHTRRG